MGFSPSQVFGGGDHGRHEGGVRGAQGQHQDGERGLPQRVRGARGDLSDPQQVRAKKKKRHSFLATTHDSDASTDRDTSEMAPRKLSLLCSQTGF